MKRFATWTLLTLATTWTLGSVGCKKAADAPAAPAVGGAAATDKPKDDPLAKLSEADHARALAQKFCPVTDEALGSMGTPIKVTVEGRDVFLCCEGCVDALKADPAKYLAKLDAAAKPEGDAKAADGKATE
jgi:hypothetical protein